MDTKALAKSKRAHTLHNKNKNPHSSHHHQKSKLQSGGATSNAGDGSNKKPVSKQDKERVRQSTLPSNWDRYDDEEQTEFSSVEPPPSDIVLPKSKGADFRYLVSEAQSNSSAFLSLDDAFTGDFAHGVGSMLSVRGEGILSWIGNDNFIVDDETTARHEASFLSLNLQALAEQLAKVDASESLFIEADLLPPEMTDQGSKTSSNVESDEIRMAMSEASTSISQELATDDISEKNKLLNEDSEDILSAISIGGHLESRLSEPGLNTLNQAKDDLIYSQDGKSSQIQSVEHPTQINTNSAVEFKKETSASEAADAEAELDMLLDSFSETKLLDSSGHQSGTPHISEKDASTGRLQLTKNAPLSSNTSISANLDDVLDDLLEETSNLLNQNLSYKTPGAKGNDINFPSSSSQSVAKSKAPDDFDSWFDTL